MSYTSKSVGIGDRFDLVAVASGNNINMRRCKAVTFTAYSAAGDQVLTLYESIGGASEQLLAKIDVLHKRPGAGGVWTEVTQAAGSSYTHSDATNDMVAVCIGATELSAGYDTLKIVSTADTTVALTHGLVRPATPDELVSPILTGAELIANLATGHFKTADVDADDQTIPNLVGSDVMTRGSTGSGDANDPRFLANESFPYAFFPDSSGSYTQAAGLTATATTDTFVELTARFRLTPDSSGDLHLVGTVATATSLAFRQASGKFIAHTTDQSSLVIGAVQSTGSISVATAEAQFVWGRARIYDSSVVDYWYSFTDTNQKDKVEWSSLGSVTGSNGGDGMLAFSTMLVGADTTGAARGEKLISYASYESPSRTTVWDPANQLTVADADSGNTTWVSSAGETWTIGRTTTGYKTLMIHSGTAQTNGSSDYMQTTSAHTPTFTATTGAYSFLVAGRRHGTSGGGTQAWSSTELSSDQGIVMRLAGGTTASVLVGGTTTAVADGATGVAGDGSTIVVGAVVAPGTVAVYDNVNGLGATPVAITGVGTINHGPVRLMSRGSAVALLSTQDWFSLALFEGRTLTGTEADVIAAQMIADA